MNYPQLSDIDKFKHDIQSFGYEIPKNAEFFKVIRGKNKDLIGMKVGEYTHSCHIETSDIFVLLHFDAETHKTYVKDYWEYLNLVKIN